MFQVDSKNPNYIYINEGPFEKAIYYKDPSANQCFSYKNILYRYQPSNEIQKKVVFIFFKDSIASLSLNDSKLITIDNKIITNSDKIDIKNGNESWSFNFDIKEGIVGICRDVNFNVITTILFTNNDINILNTSSKTSFNYIDHNMSQCYCNISHNLLKIYENTNNSSIIMMIKSLKNVSNNYSIEYTNKISNIKYKVKYSFQKLKFTKCDNSFVTTVKVKDFKDLKDLKDFNHLNILRNILSVISDVEILDLYNLVKDLC